MSKRTNILLALRALAADALPAARVIGLDGDEDVPQKIHTGGLVIVRSGDPGDPQVDLSPPAWHWDHRIPMQFFIEKAEGQTREEALGDMIATFGAAIALDPTLGGQCDWAEPGAPLTEDLYTDGAGRPPRGGDLVVSATYTTTSPLG